MEEKSLDVLTPGPDEPAIDLREYPNPENDIEKDLAEVLADVMRVERVSIDSHFFDDLGANSLVMAHFCARVRKRADLPSASMKDIYRHPTIRSLATGLANAAPVESSVPAPAEVVTPVATARYAFCGTLQFVLFLGYSFCAGFVADRGYAWVSAASGVIDIYLRSFVFGSVAFIALCTFPIAAKWLLIGRWKSREFPVWGLTYLRFWTVKVLIHANPMIFFVGNPLYVLYLRALGARIGKGVTILSRSVPACPDLFTVGAWHGDPQRPVLPLLPGARRPYPDRPGHPRPGRVHRREDRARHRHVDGRRGSTRPHVHAVQRSGGPGRSALARVPGTAHAARLPEDR